MLIGVDIHASPFCTILTISISTDCLSFFSAMWSAYSDIFFWICLSFFFLLAFQCLSDSPAFYHIIKCPKNFHYLYSRQTPSIWNLYMHIATCLLIWLCLPFCLTCHVETHKDIYIIMCFLKVLTGRIIDWTTSLIDWICQISSPLNISCMWPDSECQIVR